MRPLSPFIHGRTLMEMTDSRSNQRWPWHAERCFGRKDVATETHRCRDQRLRLRDTIASLEIDAAGSDETYFLARLRAVVAAFETPADRLLAKYRGDRPS